MVKAYFKWFIFTISPCEGLYHDLLSLGTLDSFIYMLKSLCLYVVCLVMHPSSFIIALIMGIWEIGQVLFWEKMMRHLTFILDHELGRKLMKYWDYKIGIWTESPSWVLFKKLMLNKVYTRGCVTTLVP